MKSFLVILLVIFTAQAFGVTISGALQNTNQEEKTLKNMQLYYDLLKDSKLKDKKQFKDSLTALRKICKSPNQNRIQQIERQKQDLIIFINAYDTAFSGQNIRSKFADEIILDIEEFTSMLTTDIETKNHTSCITKVNQVTSVTYIK